MLLTRTLRGSNVSTILQAKTGIQPHPVTLQSSRSDPVLCRQDRSPDPGSGAGGRWALRESQWGQDARGAAGSQVGECRGEALGGSSKARGGAFFPLLPWLRGARAQAEKQGCYVAMETEGSSLPHSRNLSDWGVEVGRGCFPGSTKGWG